MIKPVKRPPQASAPAYPQPPEELKRQVKATEPREVLGLHKNSGQKDHKGAR